jgi:hypothetical protein
VHGNYTATRIVRTVPSGVLNDKFAVHLYTLCRGIFYANVYGMHITLSINVLVMKVTLLYGYNYNIFICYTI